jgi:alpha-glucosidase
MAANRLAILILLLIGATAAAEEPVLGCRSPDGRNLIGLYLRGGEVRYIVTRDGRALIGPSVVGPIMAESPPKPERLEAIEQATVDQTFPLYWGRSKTVRDHHERVTVAVEPGDWRIELRAYDDGVAFRYELPAPAAGQQSEIRDDATCFDVLDNPQALFNTLASFTSSHEALYERMPVSKMPAGKLHDCPLLLTWPNGPAAAITEGRVREFAGMYLQHDAAAPNRLRCRLSPHPQHEGLAVVSESAAKSPFRVVLLADSAVKLHESDLLLCLNDPPQGDFSWVEPGKTTFPWWTAEFEEDYLHHAAEPERFLDRNKRYIDYCAKKHITYHSVHGDGRAWYPQTSTDYAVATDDADARVARPEMRLPEILACAKERGVGIRLWVHWKALSQHLEEALAQYEAWGVRGLMVDFLDRDDQEMLAWVDEMLAAAARHKIHIQIHGSSKYSGEERTFPNLVNREGVMNLEYLKWGDEITPDYTLNVAFTRALAGPVDYHLGGFRNVSPGKFEPRNALPLVMGTRCHHLALYHLFPNPLPMVADTPEAYEGQGGFELLTQMPTTWDETRAISGEPGEYLVLARRSGAEWWLAGITNDKPRELKVPLNFLPIGYWQAQIFHDGFQPTAIREGTRNITRNSRLAVKLASGGGLVVRLRPREPSAN